MKKRPADSPGRRALSSRNCKERIPMTTVQEHELDRTTAADMWQCRYRYATNCTTTSPAKQGMYTHEKSAVAHADHRVTLRDCPECGMPCGDEGKRGMHR